MTYSSRNLGDHRRQGSNPALARGAGQSRGGLNQPTNSEREDFDAIPMEYRAQIRNRCQRQYVQAKPKGGSHDWRSDIQRWHEEWMYAIERSTVKSSQPNRKDGADTKIVEVEIDWRLLTNSGMDEGFIRPVINNQGFPVVPGSSIKGMFRREWVRQGLSAQQLETLCGSATKGNESIQGALRFDSSVISDLKSLERSLDITHPQEEWQLGINKEQSKNEHNPYGLVTLWKPRLKIAISSQPGVIDESTWTVITKVLNSSFGAGVGGRTAAGYGRVKGRTTYTELFRCQVRGEGIAPKLLDISGTAEFRPVSIRASVRGMAMRLFAGLLSAQQTKREVDRLFGSLNGPTMGLLAFHFEESLPVEIGAPAAPSLDRYTAGRWDFNPPLVMRVNGEICWELALPCAHKQELSDLLASIHGLVMSLGGFSKGWRRVDHRVFPLYRDNRFYSKTPIGCQWDWDSIPSLAPWVEVRSKAGLEELIETARKHAITWLGLHGHKDLSPQSGCQVEWREVIHPSKMKAWARFAESNEDCRAIDWFHQDRIRSGNPRIPDVYFKDPSLVGQSRQPSRVGHVWHRMLPIHDEGRKDYNSQERDHFGSEKLQAVPWEGRYLEIITYFPGIIKRDLEQQFLCLMRDAHGGSDNNFMPINFA